MEKVSGQSDSLLLGFELGNMEIMGQLAMETGVERMPYNGVVTMEGHTKATTLLLY